MPAGALELGDIRVNSTLGQPLRASIAYALNPTEQIANYCIFLRPSTGGSGIPVLSQAQISVTGNAIILTGNTPIREPMLDMQLAVDCPYTPHLVREYTLMIDPARPAAEPAPIRLAEPSGENVPTVTPQANTPVAARPVTAEPARPVTPERRAAIAASTRYTVVPGDTVSTIVSRIEGRSIGMWPAVNAIFAANPDAFIDGDVNRLMAGKVLDIPDMVGTAPGVTATTPRTGEAPVSATSVADAEISVAIDTLNNAPTEITTVPSEPEIDAAVVVDATEGTVEATLSADESVNQLRPGDVILPPIETGESTEVIPNTAIDTIIDDDSAFRVAPGAGNSAASEASSEGAWNWLIWLGGTGLALILGLLLFGRKIRERFGSLAIGADEIAGRRADDDPTQRTRVAAEVDYNFEDTVNSKALSLDADFNSGNGFDVETDVDVAEDYGFSAGSDSYQELDMEIPAETSAEDSSTDIITAKHRNQGESILDSEVVPESDEEYDLSMIVDATKQPIGEYDATAKDLQAIPSSTDLETDATDEYTLNNEIDYEVLEQDYEDELTASQILNAEVEKVAQELTQRLQADKRSEITAEMPAVDATTALPQVDDTLEMPAKGSEEKTAPILPAISDPENTAELTANLPTTLEAENDSDSGADAEQTIEMSAAGSDITVEMHVESGKVDTKKNKK